MTTQEPDFGRQWTYEARGDDGELLQSVELGSDEDALRWGRILADETGKSVKVFRGDTEIGPSTL